VALVALAACSDSSVAGPSVTAGYSYVISGGESRSAVGDASTIEVPSSPDALIHFVHLGLLTKMGEEQLEFIGDNVVPGTYTVVVPDTAQNYAPKPNELVVHYVRAESADRVHIYTGQSGIVTITKVSATGVVGTFSLTAKGGIYTSAQVTAAQGAPGKLNGITMINISGAANANK
jgi:hypothetical protein